MVDREDDLICWDRLKEGDCFLIQSVGWLVSWLGRVGIVVDWVYMHLDPRVINDSLQTQTVGWIMDKELFGGREIRRYQREQRGE